MSNEKYTWKQVDEVLAAAGIDDTSAIRRALNEMTDYPKASQGVDPQSQEKLEPRAPAEKAWADRHTVNVIDRPDAVRQDTSEDVDQASFPVAPTSVPKPETSVSFDRIRKMMS